MRKMHSKEKLQDPNYINDKVMRARDGTVTGENFKPNTRYYVFFDGIDVNAHMTPTSSTYGIGSGTAKGTGLRSDALGKVSATLVNASEESDKSKVIVPSL